MKHILTSLILTLLSINFAVAASGDADAGKTKAATCAACHGSNGIGASDTFPNLAGQHADYIVKQLKAFKSGDRKDPLMSPMAAPLSEQDMADVAAYFSALPRDGASQGSGADNASATGSAAPVAYVPDPAAGKSLYELGDPSRNIASCIGCHGTEGHSEVLIYPNLANQHPEYIAKQLMNFKNKSRDNYAMNQFAGNMTKDDIADMAAYFADPAAVANVVSRRVMPAAPITAEVIAGKAKSATCAACHGADGNSSVAMYPKLAGQSADYLIKQLQEFKAGTRENAVMAPMAAALSEQDMLEIASYYAAQKVATAELAGSEIGKKLYFGGNVKRKITACVACHGVNGKGMNKAGFPTIAGQNETYLKAQLMSFKKGERNNDYNTMMQSVASKLSESDMDELAKYMASMK
ncbi:MAG: c-type cytochrome [Colwellia polaris]|jgi:cytochrome c553|uniref:c-type cytochrome n=1 Tax=Colwellia polaris TaxID=326537 RepID=UPI0018E983F4|nr:c-type cytochrome [Colwellia polaris]|tara:strand:- start:1032 stop:2258 length:1227 start_codon:yes stop_codon:yes gene_type:complete